MKNVVSHSHSGEVRTSPNQFSKLRPALNLEPDHRSGSGPLANHKPDFGPVLKSSGLNLGSELDHSITNNDQVQRCLNLLINYILHFPVILHSVARDSSFS